MGSYGFRIETAKEIAIQNNLTVEQAKQIVDFTFARAVDETLKQGVLQIRGFGTLFVRSRQPRVGYLRGIRHPIPARRRMAFKPSKTVQKMLA